MPTYEYRCKACGHELEVQQSFSDDPLETCPECEGQLKKVYGNVGISFKGSGFYKNDARGSSKTTSTPSSKSDSSSTSSTSDSSSSKSDSPSKSDSSSSSSTGSAAAASD